MENITFSINSKVKELMDMKKVSINDLAKHLQMAQPNVSRMLKQEDLKVSTIIKIAHLLSVPISTFFEEMDKDIPPAPQKIDVIYQKIDELLAIAKQSEKAVFAV